MNSRSEGRTIVIGVDSLDLLLVERWAAAGYLPFFASQLRDCSLVRLSTSTNVLQGALWPDLISGRSPGHHGTYFLTQITNGTYHLDLITADRVRAVPYYGLLDARGVRCAIVDFPHVMPIDGFRGLHIVDWLSEFQTWQFTVQPPTQQREVESHGILKPTGGYGSTENSLDGHRELRRKLEAGLQMKSAFAKQVLQRDDLDHICVVYGEAHKAGHHFWKYMDPTHPDHVAVEPYLRDGMRDIYQLIDKHLGELAQQITPRDNLVIFTEHGMQANYRGDQFVVPILERLGLCAPAHSSSPGQGGSVKLEATASMGGRLRAALHAMLKIAAPESAVRKLRDRFGVGSRIDWSRNRVFQLPTDRNSFLRVNLRGREPQGIVAPGHEYDSLLSHIESEFRALINVDTGRPAVEAVYKIHALAPGPRVNELPDLGIVWSTEAPIETVESPRLGRIHLRVHEDRTGNHRPGGFMLARGPGIRRRAKEMRGHLLQLPATLLALHGIERPEHYEMPAMDELLVESSRALPA